MLKKIILLLFILSFYKIDAQITLTNNIGTELIKTDMYSCLEDENWGRVFKLSDFGIAPNEQFFIKSAQIGIAKSDIGANLYFSVYIYDEKFPDTYNSYFEKPLLGTRGVLSTKVIDENPEIMQLDFDSPIIVPAGVEKIIVFFGKGMDYTNYSQAEVFIAGTQEDKGDSWYVGCKDNQLLKRTTEMNTPIPNANFYINVTGETSNVKSSGPIARLSHNTCDDLVKTNIHGCYGTTYYWARDFNLKDFGISNSEEYIITSGQVGVNDNAWGATVSFNIYKIDDNFPASFSETDLIGSSQTIDLPPAIGRESQIIQLDFNTPIIIPAGVEKILVEVQKGGNSLLGGGSQAAFIAGSTQDNGISWFKGCAIKAGIPNNEYVSTADFGVSDANFYINVTGNVKNVSNHFEMNYTNNCADFLKEFSIDDETKIASVVWNFGDPASGIVNTSNDLSPYHDFSSDGTYTITATVTAKDGTTENLSETIDVKEPPKAYGIDNIYSCEDNFNTGISSSFNTATISQQVLGGQTDKVITFIDGKGNKYSSLPNPFTNTVKDRETITVRVSHKDNLCCYSETSFDLIVNPLPDITMVKDLKVCSNTSNGYATFNLNQAKLDIKGSQSNLQIEFYHQNNQLIIDSELGSVTNTIKDLEIITVKVKNLDTDCFITTTFKLIASTLPIANSLNDLIGCDDNEDGISEYFYTSNIQNTVLGNQTGMQVSYFDSNGNSLPSPLPNPYSNSIPNKETITVRVTNPLTNCYSEALLNLVTSKKPQINQPQNLYTCDDGNGFSHFDLTKVENQIIGNQTGLIISYSDELGNPIPQPAALNYQNSIVWSQKINVKVENQLNPLCYSETSFKLIVNRLPEINLEKNYYLCDLEPSLSITTNPNFDSWEWKFEDNIVISNSFEANLIEAGKYTLHVSKINNGISCENSFSFHLIRSALPKIQQVNHGELGNNFIEIIASGDGDFEYSIDGINYQASNYFTNIQGGNYTVYVKDKKGCGEDYSEVTIIDYPKFFTPNNDGYNDYWQIKGINKFPNSKILIFDRYGKLLKELTPNSQGWDGIFNGKTLQSDDYWFKVNLENGNTFSGHFSLKR